MAKIAIILATAFVLGLGYGKRQQLLEECDVIGVTDLADCKDQLNKF